MALTNETAAVRLLLPQDQHQHHMHGTTRIWAETNCYVDVWIELLNGLGCDPAVALGCSLALEFEGDQWTFLKYPLEDLTSAYGVDVTELALWRSTEAHIVEQLNLKRVVIVEVDAFHLPDTRATSYGNAHVKTSIAITGIDPASRTLEYFHGPGHFVVEGDDYSGLLRLNDPARFTGDVLPPYAELVKLDRLFVAAPQTAQEFALSLGRKHLARRRSEFLSADEFSTRLLRDSAVLLADVAAFHAYAFATVRQLGSASELAADLCHFLAFDDANAAFLAASQSCKSMQFKLARLAAGRSVDLPAAVNDATSCWITAMHLARDAFSVPLVDVGG